MNKLRERFNNLVDMSGQNDFDAAAESIRKGIYFHGSNVWILACAIIIASVGLNVNSIPVIIGAMLISPVMGPILGFGFGLGTRDIRLVRDSLRHFGVMAGISILVSALYFILSPLNLVKPTELFARTNPTIYDVLIAFCGGFAGMLEISRKEKNTVLPGVAIATALMPPLCTIGYGISQMSWHYIIGAAYLFIINSIFIALATFLTVKYLKYPVIEEGGSSKLNRNAAAIILVAIIVPSIFSAIQIIKESNFSIKAAKVVDANRATGQAFIYEHKIDNKHKPPMLELYMAGKLLSAEEKETIYNSAEEIGISRSQILFHEDASRKQDSLPGFGVFRDIYKENSEQIHRLNDSIASLNGEIAQTRATTLPTEAILKEMNAQYPEIKNLTLARGASAAVDGESENNCITVLIDSSTKLDAETSGRIKRWLKARFNGDSLQVIISVKP